MMNMPPRLCRVQRMPIWLPVQGVVCGNEAVWTVEPSDGDKALLGMDLVR